MMVGKQRKRRRRREQQQQEKRTKREEECVSERVISWKQFTLKQQPEGEKKMLNTMTWTHRETDQQRGDRGGGRGETHQSKLTSLNINKRLRQSEAGQQDTHRRLGGCVQGLHLCVGHPHVTGRLQSGEKGSSEEMKKQRSEWFVLAHVKGIS